MIADMLGEPVRLNPIELDPPLFEMIASRAPSRRIGEPADIAGAALFLASHASAYVNGHCLVVDGDMTLNG
jgi:NAD(P)-dependent dehydrogenase (short-subunit alcohol dehydrogenase family)